MSLKNIPNIFMLFNHAEHYLIGGLKFINRYERNFDLELSVCVLSVD